MTVQELVSTYGYAAIVVGTFLEGETILVLGGLAAHRGYLELSGVILAAFLGTLCGDQLFFYVGRARGRAIVERRPAWRAPSEQVFSWLARRQTWLILGFRFLYGLRTITPIVIGAARVAPLRFLALNALGAFVWAAVIGGAGYLFGHTLEAALGDLRRYELAVAAVVATVGAIVGAVRLAARRRSSRAARAVPEPPRTTPP